MTLDSDLLNSLATAADAAAERWNRWGPSENVGYPLPTWNQTRQRDSQSIMELCDAWLEKAGVTSGERRASAARVEQLAASGIDSISILDASFPPQLRAINNPPLVLHVLGKRSALGTGVAMVGSREPEMADFQEVDRLASALAKQGIAVITGMARGIDKASVLVASREGGISVGVVPGSPLDIVPKESQDAYDIVRESGCIISEVSALPRGSRGAIRASFLRRNRLISGLARVVVAFKPGANGGTFNQLEWAHMQGRPIIVVGPKGRDEFTRAASNHFLFQESSGPEIMRDADKLWTQKLHSPQMTLV